jgi:hypothetical protein
MSRFNRVYRLLVGRAGRTGIEVTHPLRITFDVEKNAAEEPNVHTIRIFNLQPDRRREFEENDLRVRLYAGYAEEDGALLMAAGTVVDAFSFFDGPDVVTELRVADGYAEIRDTAVSLGYAEGVVSSAILRELAGQMGLPLLLGEDVPERSWANGFSFYGPARAALHKVVAGTGAEWSIQNQELQVVAKRGVTRRQAFVLAADSGLVGYPERTSENAREKAKVKDLTTGNDARLVSARQQRQGWRVTSLLLPTINPGDLVKMESRTVTGFWRAESVHHQGDSDGGDWQTELQLVDRNAPPKDPQRKRNTTS